MYLVRTDWPFIRTQRANEADSGKQVDTDRDLEVLMEGLETMLSRAEERVAQGVEGAEVEGTT
jgi:hypothetical protein